MKKINLILPLILICSLFSSGCVNPFPSSSQSPVSVSIPESSTSESVPTQSAIAQSLPSVSSPSAVSYPLYDIMGTATTETGKSWTNMLAWRKDAVTFAEKYPGIVYTNMNQSEKIVYLTFDDGPDSLNTVSVMNTLLQYHAGGTFFFTGVNMKAHPTVVKEVYDNGFTIGLHGYDHTSLSAKTATETEDQLDTTNQLLFGITGKQSFIMRPPYGDLNDATIDTIHSMNLRIYLWSIDTLDWTQKDKADILRNVKENLRPGDIILMHSAENEPLSAEILPEIIQYIQSQHYEIKNLPEE